MKKEIKKLEDMLPFNPYKVLGLLPKKPDEKYKKYASLNRRMIASTIDTGIATFTIAPIIDWLLQKTPHASEVTREQYLAVANANPDMVFTSILKLFVESGDMAEFLGAMVMQILGLLISFAICWKIWSSSPGKMVLRMKIVDAKTEKSMTDIQILLRTLGLIPACGLFFLGIFWIGFNKRRQGWHDMIANTVVIIIPKKSKIDNISEKDMEKAVETAASISS